MQNNITHSDLLALCYSVLFQPSKGQQHEVQQIRYSPVARPAKYVVDVKFGLVISVCYVTRQLRDSELCVFFYYQYICNLHMWPRAAGFTPKAQNLICPQTRAPSHGSVVPRLLRTEIL